MIVPQSKSFIWIGKHWAILLIAILFILIRLPGISLPYYQDEWKNISAAASVESAGAFYSHPPFFQMLFVVGRVVFGENQFRLLPLLFSTGALMLVYLIMRKSFGQVSAIIAAFLLAVTFFNVWGSLMADVDGSIIPFFFLLTVYFHDEHIRSVDSENSKRWAIALIVACLIGLLIKLNFILAIGAIVVDYIFINWRIFSLKSWSFRAVGLVLFGFIYIGLLYFIQAIYPAFSISLMLGHANQFASGVGRDYTQIIVQGVKTIYYLSPLLLVPILFISKEVFRKTRVYFLYLIFGCVFYFILFDFSRGALDKYLMFAIVPLAIISGAILANIFKSADYSWKSLRKPILVGTIIALALIAINFMPQAVVALYPKTEWFSRIFHGNWNFLIPFNGGSGPIGFYVSFLFIVMSFIISLVLGIVGFIKKDCRSVCAVCLILIGVIYNAVFFEEMIFGKINGNSSDVLKSSVGYIANNDSIKQVLSYNDIGNHELSNIGKSAGRFYAAPQFENNHRKVFADFKGQYLVVDISHISENIFYGKFFARCNVLFETISGKISGRVYDCPNSKAIIDGI